MAKEKEKQVKRKNTTKIILTILVITGPFCGLALALFLTSIGAFGELPSIEQIANPETKLATEIITEDNEVLGTFFYENRTPADYEEISPNLINALVATEDERFFNHSGIDARALARAISGLGSKGGGLH